VPPLFGTIDDRVVVKTDSSEQASLRVARIKEATKNIEGFKQIAGPGIEAQVEEDTGEKRRRREEWG
jgi:hypothetical protein